MAYVYTCEKCGRPTSTVRKVAGVTCCGVEQTEAEFTNGDDVKERWATWKAKMEAVKQPKPGEKAQQPKKPRKKGGVRRK